MDLDAVLRCLPSHIVPQLRQLSSDECLNFLAQHTVDLQNGSDIFPLLEPALPEVASRWLLNHNIPAVVGAFGRVVPSHPYLASYPYEYFRRHSIHHGVFDQWGDTELSRFLLGLYRLAVCDSSFLADAIKPSVLLPGLQHENKVIKFLVIKLLCHFVCSADASVQDILKRHVGDGEVIGPWEDKSIDYRLYWT